MRHVKHSFADRPDELDLVYVNNEQELILRMQVGMRRLFKGRVLRSLKDADADRRILRSQPGKEYESGNYEDCSIWRWTGLS